MAWIDKLVGRSPIRPMQEHMKSAVECARQLVPLVDAMAEGDIDSIRATRERIDELEHTADEIKNEIRSHLPRRLMLAMERRDMLEILDSQDSIADVTQDVAELADQREMRLPEPLISPLKLLSARVVQACEQADRVINELDELLETGFGARETSRVEEMISQLCQIETETDDLQDAACRALFAIESDLGVATVFWHQTIQRIPSLFYPEEAHAQHHVAHDGTRGAGERLGVVDTVSRTAAHDTFLVDQHDRRMGVVLEAALRALHLDVLPVDGDLDPLGEIHR